MGKRDYYDILGVGKSADAGELKKAYRRLAMKHHPDRNQDDPAAQDKFKEAKLAYEILKDPQKRAVYDQYGHAGIEQQAGGGGGFHADVGDVFGDIFGDIFGSGRRRSSGRSGADLKYGLEMTLEDAVFGKETEIRVPTYAACSPCDGTGSADGKQNRCTTCNGVGQVRMQQGFFSVQQTCPTCRGKGSTMSNPCTSCHGQGRVREEKTLSVSIPAGVDTGDRIRLSGEGEAGVSGGPAGDLYVEVHVRPHAIFTRDGNDLFCEIPIAYTEATLGGELELPTLSGSVRLKVPPGTQSNKTFKVRGKGVKSVRSHETGNLMARLVVETPVNLSKRQRELLREFEATFEGRRQKHSPKSHSWLDGVKQFFENIG